MEAQSNTQYYNSMESTNNQDCEWLSQTVILRLFASAAQQFKNETYDINKIARNTISSLQFERAGDQEYNSSSNTISKQVLHICSLLGQTPKYFIQLLNEEFVTSHSHIVTLNSRNQLVARRFFKDFSKNYDNSESIPKYQSNEKIRKEMYGFINTVAKKMCKVYDECSTMLKKDIEKLTQRIKKSKIMNNYVLYKIFREISQSTKRLVEQKCIQTVFRNCPQEVIHQYFHYIINKFEVVKLFANQHIDQSMFQPSPIVFFGNFQRNSKIILMPKQAVNSQGKFAIFVKTYSQDGQLRRTLEDYLLILDEQLNLRVINCKTLRKQWYITNDIKTNLKLTIMAKDYLLQGQQAIDTLLKSKNAPIVSLMDCQPLQSYTNFNGVIGRSLFLMKRYTRVSSFFKDLSKRAILTKSMEEIIHQIPIVSYMILAGTFSTNFYKIFTNKFSTEQKKFKQFGSFMFGTTVTVGSSIAGAITGQMLIPIPVVGALIGSVIGGLIGDKSSKQINSWIQKKKFLQTINYLQKSQVENAYWLCTEQFYNILQLKQKQFQKYVPGYMYDYVFATLIAFVLVCFYESKRLNDHNLQKNEKLPQIQQDNDKDKDKGYGNQYERNKQKQFQLQIQKLGFEQQQFETEFDLMKIIEFLQRYNAKLYQHYDTLQKSILSNLSKIIN